MKKNNLIVTGFMATGKSTLGPLIAHRLNYDFVDLDQFIEQKEKMSITCFFEKYGENDFRKQESFFLKQVLLRSNQVLSLGGGTLLSKKNRTLVAHSGRVLCLCASLKTLQKRLACESSRPLVKNMSDETLVTFYQKRQKIYDKISWKVSTEQRSLNECIEEIYQEWKNPKLKFV